MTLGMIRAMTSTITRNRVRTQKDISKSKASTTCARDVVRE
jgi:hypothetical protein